MDNDLQLVEEGLLKVSEACEFLGIGRSRLYAFMGQGELPYVKLGHSRRIPKRALIEFAARNLVHRPAVAQHETRGSLDEVVA
jgi:excisionase family DNA binding protein